MMVSVKTVASTSVSAELGAAAAGTPGTFAFLATAVIKISATKRCRRRPVLFFLLQLVVTSVVDDLNCDAL
jgi:hypothetical protein